MAKVVLLLGSNMDDPAKQLDRAIEALRTNGIVPVLVSSTYESEPWGNKDQDVFLNQGLVAETDKSPLELLEVLKEIEFQAGIRPAIQWGPRPLDIDIIFYDQQIFRHERLVVPHPFAHKRNFVLIPLLEIIPDWVHPDFDKTIETLFLESTDIADVILMEPDGETAS